jgi:L-amino acid N-acyltransferase YncA
MRSDSMNYVIRTADPNDIAAFTEIYRESVLNGVATYEIDPPSFEEMRNRFSTITGNGYPYIVAVEQTGLILGYAYASAFRTRPAYRWLAELVRRCTNLGFRQMVAVIGGAHPASIAVHRAAGFQDGGLMKATGYKHGRWLDTVIMQLALGEGSQTDPDLEAYPATIQA